MVRQPSNLLDIADIRQEDARRCKASFAYFLEQAWHVMEPAKPFIEGYHTDACTRHLQAVGDGEIHRLVANLPPGFGKSTLFSVAFPAWIWTRNAHERFLCASYALDLSIRDRHNCKMLIESEWYQSLFGDVFQMLISQNQKTFYENDKRGFMQATAVFASGTGKRCTASIIDDPNNAMAGQAEVASTVEWFGKTWIPRLNDRENGTMLLVGQRLYAEDLTAHVLELGGWEHLCLPMEFESSRKSYTACISWEDPRTKEGELLCPELVDGKGVEELKHSQGSFHYSAQQQQAPVPSTGGTFKKEWARYFEISGSYYILHTKYGREKAVAIKDCTRYAVVDPAISEKQSADFFVLQVWDVSPENEALLLAQLRGHFNNPDQQKKIVEWYERYLFSLWVETYAYQLALFQQLKNYEQMREVQPGLYQKRIVSIPVKEWRPARGDKVARAGVAAIKMEAGDMYWLLNASYLTELTPEIFAFPKSKKDDQVDGHSMIADILSNPQVPLSGYQLGSASSNRSNVRIPELEQQIEEKRRQLEAMRR